MDYRRNEDMLGMDDVNNLPPMAYNAVLSVQLSDISAGQPSGASSIQTIYKNATQGQNAFAFPELVDGQVLMFFVDGILYTKVTSVTNPKEFSFSNGYVNILDGVDAGVEVMAFGYATSSGGTVPNAWNEPVSTAMACEWCRIDITENEELIKSIITTARMQCEYYTNIGFIYRHVKARLRNDLGGIYCPYAPVVGTVDGVVMDRLETISSDITIEYDAGYSVLPQLFKTAILTQVAYLYEHRGDEKELTLSPLAKTMLTPHRRI